MTDKERLDAVLNEVRKAMKNGPAWRAKNVHAVLTRIAEAAGSK
jgi:hypothetical protein